MAQDNISHAACEFYRSHKSLTARCPTGPSPKPIAVHVQIVHWPLHTSHQPEPSPSLDVMLVCDKVEDKSSSPVYRGPNDLWSLETRSARADPLQTRNRRVADPYRTS